MPTTDVLSDSARSQPSSAASGAQRPLPNVVSGNIEIDNAANNDWISQLLALDADDEVFSQLLAEDEEDGRLDTCVRESHRASISLYN